VPGEGSGEFSAGSARNGYFFTVDRVTGERLASGKFGTLTDWASGLHPQGRRIRNPEKAATIAGSLTAA
jgi:alcohol dehydrogenase (cytochrome c)